MGFQCVIIEGNLGTDVESRFTTDGKQVSTFRVAVNGYNNEAEWFSIVAWEKRAEWAEKWLQKGKGVIVRGRMKTRSWDDNQGVKRYRTELIAESLDFTSGKREDGNSGGDAPFEN